jgi:hypothetical protein
MDSALAKKPASVMRAYTQQVRDHTAAVARVTDHYFATLKRAEAQYFEAIKRITDAVTQASEPVADTPAAEPSSPTQ